MLAMKAYLIAIIKNNQCANWPQDVQRADNQLVIKTYQMQNIS
jgi:hypothetical protein